MARLIDADELNKFPIRLDHCDKEHGSEDFVLGIESVLEYAEYLPTVDAVPVTRCKYCKYWQDNNDGYPHEECRWGHGETPDDNDFCSYGERKNNGNEDRA